MAILFSAARVAMKESRDKTQIVQSNAGNSVKYTRAVEAAYRKMWEGYRRGAAA
jgi:hypothetical protein